MSIQENQIQLFRFVAMEMILFIGIQATGKSSFCRERFFRTHVCNNLDTHLPEGQR